MDDRTRYEIKVEVLTDPQDDIEDLLDTIAAAIPFYTTEVVDIQYRNLGKETKNG